MPKKTTPAPADPYAGAYEHQRQSLLHAEQSPIAFDVSDPGTGKTFVRLKAFERRGGCALVIATASTMESAWAQDAQRFTPGLRTSVAWAKNRAAAFEQAADLYITNHDAAKWLATQKKSFFARFSEIIIDESTAFKHHTSQRSKALASIVRHFNYRSCLTGTPNGRSITDVWHQAFLLDGGQRLGRSFYAFRNAVCTPVQRGAHANALEWVDKEGAEAAVFDLLSDITVRHRLEDCVDMPEHLRYTRAFTLMPRHMQLYKKMEKDQLIELRNHKKVSAVHASSVATKLLQIASGAVYDGEGEYLTLDTDRYALVMDLVQERAHSLVMFQWRHQRDGLEAEAKARGISYAVIDGHTSAEQRARIVADYQAGRYQTLLAHPRSAGHGLTLTRGTATIWASPIYDLELFEQGSRRQYRVGQTQRTETIVVVAPGTIDEHVMRILDGKSQRMKNLLDLFEGL